VHAVFANNRTLLPKIGRWCQADPNASGLVTLGMASGGHSRQENVSAFSLGSLYEDGASLYQYGQSSSWMGVDPMGLYWDPFEDMVDEYQAESAGNQAAYMAKLQTGFKTSMHIGLQIASLNPAIAVAIATYKIANGTATVWDALDLIPLAGKAKTIIGRAFGSYYKGQRLMRNARRAGLLADEIYELHHVVPQFMTGWTKGRVVILTKGQHDEYHRILDGILARYDMPISNEGEAAWIDFLANNEDRYQDVRAALVESVDEFKEAMGIDMIADLWTEMTRQGFGLLP
jgi:hypothetical protein